MNATVKYGATGSLTLDVDYGTTYHDLLRRAEGALGFDKNECNALVNGERVDLDDEVEGGEIVRVEKRAAAKAA